MRDSLPSPGSALILFVAVAWSAGYTAVDVYQTEPVIDHPLLHLPNTLCTPHLAYVEKDNYESYFETAFDQVLAFAAGAGVGMINMGAVE